MLRVLGRLGAYVLVLGTGAVLLAGLMALRAADEPAPAAPLLVSVFPAVEQETFISQRTFAGRIVPQRTSDIGFELGGRVTELLADDGERVSAGQELARLNTAQLENRRNELSGQRAEVEAQLTRTINTLNRQQELLGDGFSTQQQIDDLVAERDSQRARLSQIDAALDQVQTDFDDSILMAPFAGQIVRRTVDEGAVVQPGQTIFRLNESGVLEARIGVPTAYRRQVAIGDTYRIRANGLETEGVISGIVTDLATQTRTITLILTIENDPGFVARDLVRMLLDEEIRRTGIWVPTTALNESLRGLWSVFVVEDTEAGQVVARRDVEIVSIEENRAYVRGTLAHGERVIASSTFRFVPGQRIIIAETVEGPHDITGGDEAEAGQ